MDRLVHGNETLDFDERNARPQIHAHGPQYLDGLVPSQTVDYDSCLYFRGEGRTFWVGNLGLVPGPIFVILLSQPNLALSFYKLPVSVGLGFQLSKWYMDLPSGLRFSLARKSAMSRPNSLPRIFLTASSVDLTTLVSTVIARSSFASPTLASRIY